MRTFSPIPKFTFRYFIIHQLVNLSELKSSVPPIGDEAWSIGSVRASGTEGFEFEPS